jgi:pyridinium-3,5-biscarboxylic acid mononucleotide sulfurtransferase
MRRETGTTTDSAVGSPVPGASADPIDAATHRKEQALRRLLAGFESVIVAYSGGVDSAYLSWLAHDVLGDRALAITALSPSYPQHHYDLAIAAARHCGFPHEVIHTRELERPEYRANPVNRCYYCKQELYTDLAALARERGVAAILDGNNADDRGDHRPGRQAARELGVRSPLDEIGVTKAEIRALSQRAGLPSWDEPASACLSSRIPYDHEVTPEKLHAIDAAETALRALGFRVCRVRHHDDVARIELARDEMARAFAEPGLAEAIVTAVKAAGFRFVTIDLQGYRLGSLNERIPLRVVTS